jgi:hypothetical protein
MDIGSLLYYGGLAVWSALVAYTVLFSFKKEKPKTGAATSVPMPPAREMPREYVPPALSVPSTPINPNLQADGFKAFQTGPELSVDDIVQGLSRG